MHESRYFKFMACIFAIMFVWLVLLPALTQTDYVRSHIDRMQAAGIDPSAMFYTEVQD